MKVSYSWLQKYFDSPLPGIEAVDDALTFHSFEIDSIEGEVLDVKVLPNRASDALSHRSIAKEISAILNIPLAKDPLREAIPEWPTTDLLKVSIDDPKKCLRHMGALVRNVKVGPSPDWLKSALESVGQRSINNVVDLTNYVTLNMGQPLHAFDAGKIQKTDGKLKIRIRESTGEEEIAVLSGEIYKLPPGTLVIADDASGTALDIAGVKGGMASSIDEKSTDLFVSVANFDGSSIRRTAQALKLWTDASLRFQNKPSPELVSYGMRDILMLLAEVAGGELVGVVDEYPNSVEKNSVTTTAEKVSKHLGAEYSSKDLGDVFTRLDLSYTKDGETFVVTPPFERRDLHMAEDLADEVGRIIGYDRVVPMELPSLPEPKRSDHEIKTEILRGILVEEGFNEISTYTMVHVGDVELALPLAEDKKYLRTDLALGHAKAVALNMSNLPLFNSLDLRLFEIGNVWPKGEEKTLVGITYASNEKKAGEKREEILSTLKERFSKVFGTSASPTVKGNTIEYAFDELVGSALPSIEISRTTLGIYRSFSLFPFALRDVAVWTPSGTSSETVQNIVRESAGDLLTRIDLFDTFEKDGKVSYAYRLVLQAKDRTLSESELNKVMESVSDALRAQAGFQVR
jgi:phenylalanyl-tRNA synthetase beta chain